MISHLHSDIVKVVDYWDDGDPPIPWNFIRRTGDGRFEAVATHTVDFLFPVGPEQHRGECREHSVGTYPTLEHAERALRAFVVEVSEVDAAAGEDFFKLLPRH